MPFTSIPRNVNIHLSSWIESPPVLTLKISYDAEAANVNKCQFRARPLAFQEVSKRFSASGQQDKTRTRARLIDNIIVSYNYAENLS